MGEMHLTTLVSSRRVQVKWIVEKDVEKARHLANKLGLQEPSTRILSCDQIEQVFRDPE